MRGKGWMMVIEEEETQSRVDYITRSRRNLTASITATIKSGFTTGKGQACSGRSLHGLKEAHYQLFFLPALGVSVVATYRARLDDAMMWYRKESCPTCGTHDDLVDTAYLPWTGREFAPLTT